MHRPAPEIEPALTRFREALQRAGVKQTHQRLEIFREVAGSSEHPDAEMVYLRVRERIPTVSLDTVYRTLWLLIDLGLLATLGPPRGRMRFDANISAHHHFICTRCGLARDFYSAAYDRLAVPREVSALGQVERTHVELRGLCAECAAQAALS